MKQGAILFLTILATGALLNAASSGTFGVTVARGARYIADGFDTDKT